MNQHITTAGRLFSATVAGAPVTLKDLMVAAPIYLAAIESSFDDAPSLLACFEARQSEIERGASSLSNTEMRLATRWKRAHDRADRAARKLLTDPLGKEFVLSVAPQRPFISAASPFTRLV